jgi:hypothetical protein
MPPLERTAVQRRFNLEGGLLLATDAASEGLNLQERCRYVISYELPWNPARLEQRIGRVDRIGQRRTVRALTLVARDTAEDLVIARIARRLRRIAATLGERDRLSAFLDEARTAKIVITGAAEDEPGEAPLAALVRTPADDGVFEQADVRLSRRTVETSTVLVSTLRASACVPEGFVFAVRWCACASDEEVIESDVIFVHVPSRIDHNWATAAATCRAAAEAIERLGDTVCALVDSRTGDRLARISETHAIAVRARQQRERAMAALREHSQPVQPGLFDRRATALADEAAAVDQTLAHEHQRRLDLLERSAVLHGRSEIAGVLLVRRGRCG